MKDLRGTLPLTAAASIILAPLAAFAGRPFSTDDAELVDRGIIEFESGTDLLPQRQALSYFGLKHGLTERMDTGFDFSYLYPGIEGLNIETRFRFLERGNSKMALTCGFSTEVSTFDLNLIFARALSALDFCLNVGAISSFKRVSFGLSTQGSLFEDRLLGGLEVIGSDQHDELSLEALVGISYSILENPSIDTGFGMDLKGSGKQRATFGITYGR